jgi:ADP-heptose:LPS heptosyltransferase
MEMIQLVQSRLPALLRGVGALWESRVVQRALRESARCQLLSFCLWWSVRGFLPGEAKIVFIDRMGALGDVLMCTPALRELKRINPGCKVVFLTKYPELVQGLPCVDEVLSEIPCDAAPVMPMQYEHANPPGRHIACILGDLLGVRVTKVRPDCAIDWTLAESYRKEWRSLTPRPTVCVNRTAGPWTPNKDWPVAYWDELIEAMTKRYTVVELGAQSHPGRQSRDSYIDLRGRTTLRQLIAVIAACDLHVGPISGPVHIAAAANRPSVVIYGGYEHPKCSRYPGNINLYTPLSCSPCWRRTPCPYEKKCLVEISPRTVWNAVAALLG